MTHVVARVVPPNVAVVGVGEMGSSIAARLTSRGAKVRTILDGRSASTVARAHAAGIHGASPAELVECEFILSVLPSNAALTFANSLVTSLTTAKEKPIFVDCNALAPSSLAPIASAVSETGAGFVDGCIIGPPIKDGSREPRIYLSGPHAARAMKLSDFGLPVRNLDAPIGSASALKLCHSGMTKGILALAATMILTASRTGASDALRAALRESAPANWAIFEGGIPHIRPKGARWHAEMMEIHSLLAQGGDLPDPYLGFAELFRHLGDPQGSIDADLLAEFFR